MSLKDLDAVLQSSEWGKFSLEDQVDILGGAFAGEIDSQGDEAKKKALYQDYRESRKVLASNKALERLGDNAPLQIKAYTEFLETDEELRKSPRKQEIGQSGALPPTDPALGIRHLESVELLSGQDFGSEKLRKQLAELGLQSFAPDDLTKAFADPGFQQARQRALEENRDLGAVVNFSQPEPTDFTAWGKTGVEIRKKPIPGADWEVKFPDGSIETLKAQRERTTFREPTNVEKLAGGAASLATSFAGLDAEGATRRAFERGTAPVESQTYEPYGVMDTPDVAPKQLIDFVGKRSSKLGDDLRQEFEKQYGSYDVGSFRNVLLSGPIRGVMQSVEGIGGTVQQIQRAGAIASGANPADDTMASQFARGATEAAEAVRNNLAPKKADAGAIGSSLATITEAGTGLIVDMLAAKGAGRIASIGFGATAPMAAQVGKAGFAASSSTKILGSTYNDAFAAQRAQNKSLREAHDLAAKEAQSVALVTAILERAGPAEVFANPAATKAAQGLVRRALVGGAAEGLGEEAPQAIAQVVLEQAFRGGDVADNEVDNFRKALGGDWEAFKNSQIIQGAIGGFGAGAVVNAITGGGGDQGPAAPAARAADTTSPAAALAPAPNTATMSNEQLQSAANKTLVEESSKSTGQKLREDLANVGSVVPPVPAAPTTATTPTDSIPEGEGGVVGLDGQVIPVTEGPAPTLGTIPAAPAAQETSDTGATVGPAQEAAPPAAVETSAAPQTGIPTDTREQVVAVAETPEAQQAAEAIDNEMPDFVTQAITNAQLEAQEVIARYEEDMANVARDAQMADEAAAEQTAAEEQAAIQAKIDAARAEAEAPPTINRVLDGGTLYQAPPTDPHLPGTDATMAYHTATDEEVKALRQSGRLGSKATRTGEGSNAVAWVRGGANVGFPTAANKGKYVIVTQASNLDGRTKPVFKGDVAQVWQSDGTKWVEVTQDVKRPTDRMLTRAEWTRRIQEQRKKQGLRGNPLQRVLRAFYSTAVGEYFSGGRGMVSLKEATRQGLVGDGRSAARWDGAKDLTKNPKLIAALFRNGARTPDQLAGDMYDDGILPSSDIDTFWGAIRDAITEAESTVDTEFEADVVEGLLYDLLEMLSKGDPENDVEVDPYALATGDKLIIDGREFTVMSAIGSELRLQGDGKFAKEISVDKSVFEGAFVNEIRRGSPASLAPKTIELSAEEKAKAQANFDRAQELRRKNEEAFNAKRKAEQEAKQKAKAEAEAAAKPKAPVSEMDRKAADSKELFADDGGFKLAQQATQDGDAEAKRKAGAEAAKEAADKAQQKMQLEEEPKTPEAPALTETDTRTPEQKLKDALKLVEQVVAGTTKGATTITQDAVRDALVDQVTKDPDSPAALLYTIARRAASTRGAKRKSEQKALAEGNVGTLDTGVPIVDPALRPDEEVDEDDRRARLDEMMQLLSPEEREVMTRALRGQKNREIADALGLAVGTVATTRSRAKKKLEKAAKKVGPVVSMKDYAPPKPFNPSLGTDQELIDAMTDRYMAKFGGGKRPNLKAVTKGLTKAQKKAAEMGAFFGRRVVFVSGLQVNGLFDPETPSVIYVADDAEKPAAAVMYHELLHSLRATDPKAYQRLKDAVKVDLDAYLAANPKKRESSESLTREEFLADFLADRATDPDFWVKLSQKDKTLFEKIIELLQSIIKSVRQSPMGTEQFVSDLVAADAAVLEALVTLRLQGEDIAAGKKGGLKASKREADPRTARFNELTDSLYQGRDSATQEEIDLWKAANPEAWEELSEMREEVLREGGWTEKLWHGGAAVTEFNVFPMFLSPYQKVAKSYEEDRQANRGDAKTHEVFARVKNPANDEQVIAAAKRVGVEGMQGEDSAPHEYLSPSMVGDKNALKVATELRRQGFDSAHTDGDFSMEFDFSEYDSWTIFDPSQIKSADPISAGPKVTPDQWGDTGSGDIRFMRRDRDNDDAGTPVQTGGQDNRFISRAPSNQKLLEDIVRGSFDPETAPLNAQGVMQAVRFLGKLLDPTYVKSLTQRAIREGVPPMEAAIIPGVGRSAVLEFSNRLASSDPAAADTLRRKVEMAHRDIRFMFDEAIDASIVGKALRSLRSFVGGSIQRMFYEEREGRAEYAKDKYGDGVADAAKATRDADLNAEGAEELADSIAAALDPETQERIAKAEAAAREAWVKVYELYKRLIRPKDAMKASRREGDAPESRMSPDDAFRQWEELVLSPDASLEDIAAAFDALMEVNEATLEAAERDAITRARRNTADAINAKEEATGTTNTRNQVDILAKRHIGKVTRAKKQNDAELAKRRQAFQDLVNNKELGFNEFIAEYVRLGGTVEVGSDLYDANIKLLREGKSPAERDADAKVRKAVRSAEELVESLVVSTLGSKSEGRRPTAENMTPERVMRQYRNPRNAGTPETLAAQLREFKDDEGNRLFSDDHISTLVIAGGMARQMRIDAEAVRNKADAEAKIKERTEQEKAEAERLAQVAEDRAELEAEKLQDLVDTLVGDLLYPRKTDTRETAENDTVRKVLGRFKRESGGSPTQLRAELRDLKNDNGTQLLSEEQIDTLATAAEIARESAMKARRAEEKARLDEQARTKAVKAREKADRDAQALQEDVDKMIGDLVAPAKSGARPTTDNDTPRKLIARATNLDNVRIDSDTLAQLFRDFKNKDGSQRFTEEQIAGLVVATEFARNAKVEAASAKAEERDRKARARQQETEVKKARSIFSPKVRQSRDPEKRSLRQIILEDFINNPVRKIQTQAERIEFAKEILREKTDLSEADIDRVAVEMEGQLAAEMERLKLKAVTPFLKSLGNKALSREQIAKAIRLEVLDPSKDLISSVAALAGWDGLTDAEYRRLVELQAKIDIAGDDSRVATRYIAEQERIIHLARGIPPHWKDRVNTYVRGNMFSAITSLTIGPVVGAWELFASVMTETLIAAGRNKLNPVGTIAEIGVIIRAFASNSMRGFREAWEVAKTGTTFIEQVKLEQAKMDEKGGGDKIFVDPATRAYDDAMKKMQAAIADFQNNRTLNASKILWQAIRGYVLASGRLTFRALFMADAAVTKTNAGAIAEIFKYREIKRLGITKEQVREIQAEVERMVDSERMFLQTELGLSGNILEIEIQDRIEGAMLQALTLQGAQGLDTILVEAASDIQDRIGTGETSKETVAGTTTEAFGQFISSIKFPIAGVLPAIRTNGNIIDSAMWYMPVVGLYRAIRYNKSTTAERQAVFPNIRADWQFRRKQAMAALTNGAALAFYALLMANRDLPEDEKWFHFTGAYPVGDKDKQALWALQGYSEYTLYIGNMDGIKMDRGFGQQFMPALVTASMLADATDGVDGKEALRNAVALGELYIPGFSQAKGRFKATDSTYGAERFLENQATMFVPLSGLLQTGRRVSEPVDKRNTDATLLESNPFFVTADDGVMRMRNILGEPLESERNPYAWISKIGIPIQFRPVGQGRDPVKRQIMKDFYENKYFGGQVTLNEFRKKYGEDVPTTQYQAYLQLRADAFVPRYQQIRESLISRPEKFSSRIGDIWEYADMRAARTLGLQKQRKTTSPSP